MHLKNIKITAGFIICSAFILTVLGGCTKKIAFTTSPVAPAARGYVTIKKDNNENYAIAITISNLAEVERLQGGNKAYVVWMTSDGQGTKNIGQINSGSKRFSKKLRASFNSVSTSKPTTIFITAEEDRNIQYPGNIRVLSTDKI